MSLNPSISKVVPATPPTASINYDYYDVAEGTGIKNFYAFQSIASGAAVYGLTTDDSMLSGKTGERKTGDYAWQLSSDMNYETEFNLPKIIKGTARITCSQGVSSANCKIALLFGLYKVSDGTTTQIGSDIGTEMTVHDGVGITGEQKNVSISIPDRMHFKGGDTLRLRVRMYSTAAASPARVGYGCDPSGRDDVADASGALTIPAGETTQLKIGVPFVIDI